MGNGDLHARLIKNDILKAGVERMDEIRARIATISDPRHASAECAARHLDPLTTNLVVADASRTEKTICLAVSPSLKSYGIPGRARLFEVVQRVKEVNNGRLRDAIRNKTAVYKDGVPSLAAASYDATALTADSSLEVSYLVAPPRMAYYHQFSLATLPWLA